MERKGLGCLRELPDPRDWYIDTHPEAAQLFHTYPVFGRMVSEWTASASTVDLRRWCSPIESQGGLGSCTAQMAAGMVEYLERRALNRHNDASRLFIYKVTRNLLGWTGDTGAYIRSTMKALTIFGVPPEAAWPYDIARFDQEPSAYCYAYAQSFQAIRYFRVDRPQQDREARVTLMKSILQTEVPVGLGFLVFDYGNSAGEFVLPNPNARPLGGHAVMLCGFDDNRNVGTSKGAFLLRNSWGTGWGDKGYGWLPYDYVRRDLAWDIWALFKAEYLDDAEF